MAKKRKWRIKSENEKSSALAYQQRSVCQHGGISMAAS